MWEVKLSLAFQRKLKQIVIIFFLMYTWKDNKERASEDIAKQGWAKTKDALDGKKCLNTFLCKKKSDQTLR